MHHADHLQETPPDQPLLDTTPYGSGKDDAVTEVLSQIFI